MFNSRFANPNALQQFHQLLAMSAASGYPNMSMYAPQQRPRVYGLSSPFAGPQMQLYQTLAPRPQNRNWQSMPGSPQMRFGQAPAIPRRRSVRAAGYGSLLNQLPFRTPLVTR